MNSQKIWFDLYQYVSPIILTPVAYLLWSSMYGEAYHLTAIAVLVPIAFAYIVPGIGTNVLKLWKFNSPLMVGNFRIHHGFVYGSAASVLAWFIAHEPATSVLAVLTTVFVSGSVFAFWHTLYDIQAIKAGVIEIFSQARANGACPEIIALDYGPVVFGLFGATYVGCLKIAENYLMSYTASPLLAFSACTTALILCVTVPVVTQILISYKHYGHSGLSPIR